MTTIQNKQFHSLACFESGLHICNISRGVVTNPSHSKLNDMMFYLWFSALDWSSLLLPLIDGFIVLHFFLFGGRGGCRSFVSTSMSSKYCLSVRSRIWICMVIRCLILGLEFWHVPGIITGIVGVSLDFVALWLQILVFIE